MLAASTVTDISNPCVSTVPLPFPALIFLPIVAALITTDSGAFISAHGDILTADHLITPPSQVLAGVAAPDVVNYVNQHLTYGVQLTTGQVAQELASGQIESDAVYRSKSSEVYLSTDYTDPLHATDLKDLPGTVHQPIDRFEEESAFAQKDVAIVHAPFNDTATLATATLIRRTSSTCYESGGPLGME